LSLESWSATGACVVDSRVGPDELAVASREGDRGAGCAFSAAAAAALSRERARQGKASKGSSLVRGVVGRSLCLSVVASEGRPVVVEGEKSE